MAGFLLAICMLGSVTRMPLARPLRDLNNGRLLPNIFYPEIHKVDLWQVYRMPYLEEIQVYIDIDCIEGNSTERLSLARIALKRLQTP